MDPRAVLLRPRVPFPFLFAHGAPSGRPSPFLDWWFEGYSRRLPIKDPPWPGLSSDLGAEIRTLVLAGGSMARGSMRADKISVTHISVRGRKTEARTCAGAAPCRCTHIKTVPRMLKSPVVAPRAS